MGSAIVSDHETIERARKYRKIFGGGMRQVGILAAAALYALDHNIQRLKEDHDKAKYLANALSCLKKLKLNMDEVQTNMVIADIAGTGKTQDEVLEILQGHGVLVTPERRSSIRAVTHLDVSFDQVKRAGKVFQELFG